MQEPRTKRDALECGTADCQTKRAGEANRGGKTKGRSGGKTKRRSKAKRGDPVQTVCAQRRQQQRGEPANHAQRQTPIKRERRNDLQSVIPLEKIQFHFLSAVCPYTKTPPNNGRCP